MIFADFRPLALTGAVALAASLSASSAARAETPNQCARYGSDYVAVAGSNGCVKIGGHVRVDNIARAPAAPMGYASMTDGVRRASNLQPMAPFGLNDLFPR